MRVPHAPGVLETSFEFVAQNIMRAPVDDVEFAHHDSIVSTILADSALVAHLRTNGNWTSDQGAASNVMAFFSRQITLGRNPLGGFFEREPTKGTWAYRRNAVVQALISVEFDPVAIEGELRLFLHLRRERSAALAKAKRDDARNRGVLKCEACHLVVDNVYPGLDGDVFEVHHRRPLADLEEEVETHLEDLAILCANCHRAIHRTKPLMTVESFGLLFFPTNSS